MKPQGIWTVKRITSFKEEMRREILEILDKEGGKPALEHVLRRIHTLSTEGDPKQVPLLLVSVLNALALHSRFEGLSEADITKLSDLASTILQSAGITPLKSRMASLYGELHLIKSKILSRQGQFWGAAWQTQIAFETAGEELPGGSAFHFLTLGLRCMRLGHCQLALGYLVEAESLGLELSNREIARIQRLRALRLLGRHQDHTAFLVRTAAEPDCTPGLQRELAWEGICEEIRTSRNLEALVKATSRGGSHYATSYVLEAYFWAYAMPETRWQSAFPSINALSRRVQLDVKLDPSSYRLAYIFEQCNDAEIPFLIRLHRIENLLQEIGSLEKIDKQLLCWLAMARWLRKHKSFRLADLVLAEYSGICLRISRGRSLDVLGIAGDLLGLAES